MKIILVVLVASMIGLIIPTAFAEIYVHESDYPFSISHPNDWYVFEFPEDEGSGVSIDPDRTGRNGFYINLICSELRGDDCGQAGADYQELAYLKEDDKWFCETATFAESHFRCFNYQVIDEYAHQLDGYRAFTIVSTSTLMQDGKDPWFPDGTAGIEFDVMATATYVLVGNDFWVIASVSDVDKFDQVETEKILSSFVINNIYENEDVFYELTWFENLINAIMSLFNWGSDSNPSINPPIEESYTPEQNYDWDNPIIIDLDPCNDWEC